MKSIHAMFVAACFVVTGCVGQVESDQVESDLDESTAETEEGLRAYGTLFTYYNNAAHDTVVGYGEWDCYGGRFLEGVKTAYYDASFYSCSQ